MKVKLDLRLDAELIQLAESYARERGESLSQIVADYLGRLPARPVEEGVTTPLVRSLRGLLRGSEIREADYRRHLEEKYL